MHRPIDCLQAVAFDLDGTLVDSAPDIAEAVNVMLRMFGYTPLPQHCISALIGNGVERLVEGALAQSVGQPPNPTLLRTAVGLFERLYLGHLFEQSRVYPGVIEALEALRAGGISLCCITNKNSLFALPLLKAARLDAFFAFTLCADRREERKPRPDLLLAACARFAITPPGLLYVGDSRNDVIAACAAGCPIALVDYGYNHGLPIAQEAPDWIIENLTQIVALTRRRPAVFGLAGERNAR